MYCNQCQETLKNTACTIRGVCGKAGETSDLQDLLIYTLQGMALYAESTDRELDNRYGAFACKALFATITNANFDDARISALIREALTLRHELKAQTKLSGALHDAAVWQGASDADFAAQSARVGIQGYDADEDARSLKLLMLYGLKGIAAYAEHAEILGKQNFDIYRFVFKALAALTKPLPADTLTAMVLETGSIAVTTMALLDEANTSAYGHPEMTEVNIGVQNRPGILISGHDLKDMEALLHQTEGTGVDVYTHSEMLPANYYPRFKKYQHFVGNYGNAWWKQGSEFESFNGPVIMTTNCITPVRESYRDRIFTTGMAGFPGVRHIAESKSGEEKDFSEVIALAKTCVSPQEIETGTLIGGFAHQQVMALSDKIVAAVKSGAIKRFVVMAGCDGRQPGRNYFTEVAEALPQEAVILTAGCAKYRYNKLNLGDIGGIPRVLDAGQCNDSYSLAVIALKLKEIMGAADINDLPISFDIAWYEQKAVTVLLALLHLGFKGIRLGPTLPAFLSPGVVKVLVENFNIKPIGDVAKDVADMMGIKDGDTDKETAGV
ncbi:hydroxylamine reductase [bacterium]|nr:hydroxylamine reductase [bacterium]